LPDETSLRHYASLLGVGLSSIQQWMRPRKWRKALPFKTVKVGSMKCRVVNKKDLLVWMEEVGRLV
jgi:hypothetical protein